MGFTLRTHFYEVFIFNPIFFYHKKRPITGIIPEGFTLGEAFLKIL